jgi:hypothetical protein
MKKRLHLQLTLTLVSAVLSIVVVSSYFFYQSTYADEIKRSETAARGLIETVEDSAKVAVYLNNRDMALEVVNGLVKNEIVAVAELRGITDADSLVVSARNHLSGVTTGKEFEKNLFAPFEKDELIGTIKIHPNIKFMEERAQETGFKNVIALSTIVIAVMLLSIVLLNNMFTKNVVRISRELHSVTPGDDVVLKCPKNNEENEVGLLVKDINALLQSTRNMVLSKEKLIQELQSAMKEIKLLSGILPICASCKRIRDDEGYWQAVEVYIRDHSEADFTHGMCDHCLKKDWPEVYDQLLKDGKIAGLEKAPDGDDRSKRG